MASPRRATPPTSLSLTAESASGRAHVPYLRRYLLRARRLCPGGPSQLSVALVGDRTMSALHEQFLGHRGPTDVLSFPLEADRRGRVVAGEVVVCVPEARRQAKARKLPLRQELLLYALHGMLHLAGFDDRTVAAFKAIHRREDMILTRLGIGPTFAPPSRPPIRGRRAARKGAR